VSSILMSLIFASFSSYGILKDHGLPGPPKSYVFTFICIEIMRHTPSAFDFRKELSCALKKNMRTILSMTRFLQCSKQGIQSSTSERVSA
jgi:hypothetical protein